MSRPQQPHDRRNRIVRSTAAKSRRAKRIKAAAAPGPSRRRTCMAWPCKNLTQRAAGQGMSERLCGVHSRQLARHGSFLRKSFPATVIAPYLSAAFRSLKAHSQSPAVIAALGRLDQELAFAGHPENVASLRGTSAMDRAKNALARLRVTGIRPQRLLQIALATKAAVADDTTVSEGHEFLTVQVAKQAHRLAARYIPPGIKPWPKGKKPAGIIDQSRRDLSRFPASSGPMLRALGGIITEQVAPLLTDAVAREIIALRRQSSDRTRDSGQASLPEKAHGG